MKQLLKSAANTAGILGLISRFAPGQVSIFCYHGFRPAGPAGSPLETKLMAANQFESQLKVFRRYGIPTSLDDLLKPDAELTGRRVVITIDDGYANTYHHAFPVLKKYNWPATLFLTTGFLDREAPLWTDWLEYLVYNAPDVSPAFRWNGSTIPLALYSLRMRHAFASHHKAILKTMPVTEVTEWLKALERHLGLKYDWSSVPELLQPLNWDQVREMRDSGLVAIGSHTVSHPILSSCPVESQETELRESKKRIEEVLGEPCRFFAYPNGMPADFTAETVSAVRRTGYSLAVTMESGFSSDPPVQPFRLRRWGAGIPPADLAYLVSGASSLSTR